MLNNIWAVETSHTICPSATDSKLYANAKAQVGRHQTNGNASVDEIVSITCIPIGLQVLVEVVVLLTTGITYLPGNA